mmetsp:Transcript_16/g.33  ORF Transcript_16/g.33 Transcript_16/m.33 type:complete len:89 (-) Transcript_16:489-755(-)
MVIGGAAAVVAMILFGCAEAGRGAEGTLIPATARAGREDAKEPRSNCLGVESDVDSVHVTVDPPCDGLEVIVSDPDLLRVLDTTIDPC